MDLQECEYEDLQGEGVRNYKICMEICTSDCLDLCLALKYTDFALVHIQQMKEGGSTEENKYYKTAHNPIDSYIESSHTLLEEIGWKNYLEIVKERENKIARIFIQCKSIGKIEFYLHKEDS